MERRWCCCRRSLGPDAVRPSRCGRSGVSERTSFSVVFAEPIASVRKAVVSRLVAGMNLQTWRGGSGEASDHRNGDPLLFSHQRARILSCGPARSWPPRSHILQPSRALLRQKTLASISCVPAATLSGHVIAEASICRSTRTRNPIHAEV